MGNNNVILRLASRDTLTENRPYRDYLDMKVVYEILDGKNIIPVTDEIQEKLDLTEDMLFETGINNIQTGEHPFIKGLNELLHEMIPGIDTPDTPGVFVLTSKNMPFGARLILVPEAIETLERIFNGEFYAIPSSIHELILVDKDNIEGMGGIEYANTIIKEVNSSVVGPDEVLSDHLYKSTELKEGLRAFKRAS